MEPTCLEELIRLAQSGHADSMERLLNSARPYLTKVAEGCLDSSGASRSASDLVQEVELLVWRRLGQFRGGRNQEETRARFHAWLRQIVLRLGIDVQRSRRARKRKAPCLRLVPFEEGGACARRISGGEEGTASERLRAADQSEQVRAAVGRIPDDKARAIVRLHYFEGLSLRQICERTGLPYHQAKDCYRHGLRFLEHELKDLVRE